MDKAPESFVEWIKSKLDEKGWGIREAARNTGLSHPTISSMITYGEQPSFETCKALATVFDVSVEEVMRIAGLLPKPPAWSAERDEWIQLFDLLSNDQRDMLLTTGQILANKGRRHAKKV